MRPNFRERPGADEAAAQGRGEGDAACADDPAGLLMPRSSKAIMIISRSRDPHRTHSLRRVSLLRFITADAGRVILQSWNGSVRQVFQIIDKVRRVFSSATESRLWQRRSDWAAPPGGAAPSGAAHSLSASARCANGGVAPAGRTTPAAWTSTSSHGSCGPRCASQGNLEDIRV